MRENLGSRGGGGRSDPGVGGRKGKDEKTTDREKRDLSPMDKGDGGDGG